jgi:adenylate kinase
MARRSGTGPSVPTALTGTPGTGKSSVAARLAPRLPSVEVGELARRLGAATGSGRSVVVDVGRLNRRIRARGWPAGVRLVVGHLAGRLPVRDVIVLRCRPIELERRLARAGRGSADDRRENAVAEATDVVLLDSLRPGRRVWEVDTTGRSVDAVARAVARRLARRGPSRTGIVDWLGDARVTEHLLDRPP